MSQLKIENINIHKIQKYLHDSQLSKKLNGFMEKNDTKSGGKSAVHIPSIQSFFECLLNSDCDGKLIVDVDGIAFITFNFIFRKQHSVCSIYHVESICCI